MRRILSFLLILALLCPLLPAALAEGSGLSFSAAPDALRPGKVYSIVVNVPAAGSLSVLLTDAQGQVIYDVFTDYPVLPGENTLFWDGLRTDFTIIPEGEYILQLLLDDQTAETPVRLGAPYPLITHIRQSDAVLADAPISIAFEASVAGMVDVSLRGGGASELLLTLPADAGENLFQWDGMLGSERVADGAYSLTLTLRTENGMESMPHQVGLEVISGETVEEAAAVIETELIEATATPQPEEPEPTPEPTPETPQISPPYSSVSDGSYWAMTPGETDDAKIWEIMTQPITVYKGVDQKEHVYLMENPDGTGKQIAQIHGQSQGLHVLGETNANGYVLVEAFSSYDDVYTPKTDEEKAHALELKQGYVKASGLETINVQQDMGLLIDKKTQRMYLFKNGERVTEFLISTGLIVDDKYHYESTVGEFITVSHSGGFYSNKYMYCDMAIRINGGILLHEVPYEPLGDGTKNYKPYEPLLGAKASHGCIRIQRKENEDGYNHRWLWDNLKHAAPYKVLVWDDLGRVDTPSVWYEAP